MNGIYINKRRFHTTQEVQVHVRDSIEGEKGVFLAALQRVAANLRIM